jgi:hypothetical protein
MHECLTRCPHLSAASKVQIIREGLQARASYLIALRMGLVGRLL